MARLDGWFDPELEELFRDDQSLLETAHLVRASKPEVPDDRGFRRRLRAELMAEARRTLAPRPHRRFSLLGLGVGHLAFGGAAVGAVAVAATVAALAIPRLQDHQNSISVYSNVAAQHAVSPNDVITVAFNQPMDEQQVVAGLVIRPATQVSTAWQGNNLVITPTHHLAGNTPYTVTIAQAALQTTSGVHASAPVEIAFGTAPTPATVAQPPSLTPNTVGPADPGATVLFSPSGGVVVTDGQVPSSTSQSSTPSPGASSTPAASASPSPASSASPAAGTGSGLIEYVPGGQAVQVAQPVSAAAFSPNGTTLATAASDGSGGSKLVVSAADGSSPHQLADSAAPIIGLTWASDGRIVYATAAAVESIDLTGTPGTAVAATPGYGPIASLSPGGAYAFLTPGSSGAGALLSVADGAVIPLQGSGHVVAFTADGSTVAWVDAGGGSPRIDTESLPSGTAAQVATLDPGTPVTGLALSGDGRTLAYVDGSGSSSRLVLASLPTGAPLAVGPAPLALAFSPDGDSLALLVGSSNGATVQLAPVPGASSHLRTGLPPGVAQVIQGFVAAQVSGNAQQMQQLSASAANAAALTPANLSRAYQIGTVASADGAIEAMVELIVDPSAAQPVAQVADETLTLSQAGTGQYQVATISIGPLHTESAGPHVVSVSSAPGSDGTTTLSLSFDSDLNPASVASAVSLLAAGHPLTPSAVHYDVDTRTLTVSVEAGNASALQLVLGEGLQDVDGNALAQPFTTTFGV
ncbi:MAG: Ig-like domain-containing protein, partial [Candidatus Dormibacteraeota bacterium]|nr:Ig-like domain-containing protein [Candidatus Dormibacteraeota bacterium]